MQWMHGPTFSHSTLTPTMKSGRMRVFTNIASLVSGTRKATLEKMFTSSNRSILVNTYACRTMKFRFLSRAILASFPSLDALHTQIVQFYSMDASLTSYVIPKESTVTAATVYHTPTIKMLCTLACKEHGV